MSKSVTYVGPYGPATDTEDGTVLPGLRIPVDDMGTFVWVSTGDTADLPDALADELVERGDFVHPSASGAPPDAPPATDPPADTPPADIPTEG